MGSSVRPVVGVRGQPSGSESPGETLPDPRPLVLSPWVRRPKGPSLAYPHRALEVTPGVDPGSDPPPRSSTTSREELLGPGGGSGRHSNPSPIFGIRLDPGLRPRPGRSLCGRVLGRIPHPSPTPKSKSQSWNRGEGSGGPTPLPDSRPWCLGPVGGGGWVRVGRTPTLRPYGGGGDGDEGTPSTPPRSTPRCSSTL